MTLRLKGKGQEERILTVNEIIQGETDDFVRNILSFLYPIKIIKRILVRQLLGKWYPYIDVQISGRDTQLSLFYGRINMRISKERTCVYCGKSINEINLTDNYIPVSLCDDCFSKVYYDYWDCLQGVYSAGYLKIKGRDNSEIPVVCENLLIPKCGYPINSERINPCLKNHAIGVILVDNSTLKVVVAPYDKIKYLVAWQGGIFGLILGWTERIMNLEILEWKLEEIFRVIISCIESLNNSGENYENFDRDFLFKRCRLNLIPPNSCSDNLLSIDTINQWVLINYLTYYKSYGVRNLFNSIFERPTAILKAILERLMEEIDIEILDFLELYKSFSPFSFELRSFLDASIRQVLNIKDISELSLYLSEYLSKDKKNLGFIDVFQEFKGMKYINFEDLKEDLEIYRIMGLLGSILIINSNVSRDPMLLDMKELIGRKVN
ncbi:MAG: hypothetical protein ACTSUT_16620 [Promethearchaeota archaeon]